MNDDYIGVKASLEAEMSICGAAVAAPDTVLPEAIQILEYDYFQIPECRELFKACCGRFEDGKVVDPVTLTATLGNEYKVVIADAVSLMPSVSNWRSYADIVIDTAKRIRAYGSCLILLEALKTGTAPECQERAVWVCEALDTTERCKAVSAKQGIADWISDRRSPREYIRTGFAGLDRYTYIDRGDYVVIGGRPSSGKTAMTLQMMIHMSQHHKVVYFSLETSQLKVFDRLIANYFNIPLSDIKDDRITDYSGIQTGIDQFADLNFTVVEASGWTVQQIQAKAVQLGAEVVFIDYLGLIKSDGGSRYEKTTNISVDLHTMAQSRKFCLVALSQLNREGREEPGMECLRESGQIEQDADIILLLHNKGEKFGSERKLIIAKNKEGRTGALQLSFDGIYQRFAEIDYSHS